MAGTDNAGIQRLLEAEDVAAKIVAAARQERGKLLAQADADAETSIEQFRQEMEKSFSEEMDSKDEGADDFAKELDEQTRSEVESMTKMYESHKQDAIQLILHHVTTVSLEVSDSLRQSMESYFEYKK